MFSYSLKGDSRATAYKKHLDGKLLALSFVTVGELHYWATKKGWGPQKLSDLEKSLRSVVIVPYDHAICETYGKLRTALDKIGRVIAANDLWIAACAVRHSIPLVTNNRVHFDGVPDLVVISEAPVAAEIRAQGTLEEIPGFKDPA